MYRSEKVPRSTADIYYYRSPDNSIWRTELTIHAVNFGNDVSNGFWIGISHVNDDITPEIRWVTIRNSDLGDLITALQYAKAISENPNLREK